MAQATSSAAASNRRARSSSGGTSTRAAGSRAEAGGKLGGEAAEVVGPGRLGRRCRDLAAELGRQLRPQAQGRAAAELEPGADGPAGALGAGAVEQLGGQAGLADAGLAAQDDDGTGAGAGLVPRAQERLQLGLAADEGKQAAGRSGRCRRFDHDGLARGRVASHAFPPQRFGQLARRGARRQAQLAAQPLAQALVGGQGGGAVAGRGQAAHEAAVHLLPHRLERDLAPGVGERCLGLGVLGQPLEQVDEAVAVGVARPQRPLVLEAGQQRRVAELRRPGELALGDEGIELAGVDQDVAVELDVVARRHDVGAARLAEVAAQGPDRAAQARAGAGVEHVGPEARGELAAGLRPGVQREPGEEAPGPASGRGRQRFPVDLHRHRPEQANSEHKSKFDGPLTGAQRARGSLRSVTESHGGSTWQQRRSTRADPDALMGRAVADDQLGAQAGEERLRNQTPFTLILEAHS